MYRPEFVPRLAWVGTENGSDGISLKPVSPSGSTMWAIDAQINMAIAPSTPARRMRLFISFPCLAACIMGKGSNFGSRFCLSAMHHSRGGDLNQGAGADVDEAKFASRQQRVNSIPNAGARNERSEKCLQFGLVGGDHAIAIL